MAVLDPRILQLVETLVAAQMDWLAFELVEGIQLGRVPVESEDTLLAARQDIRTLKPPTSPDRVLVSLEAAKRLEGDDQIEWAAGYVASRIETSIQELRAATGNLDAVLFNTDPNTKAAGTIIGLRDGIAISSVGVSGKVDRNAIGVAEAALPELRKELEGWRDRALGRRTP